MTAVRTETVRGQQTLLGEASEESTLSSLQRRFEIESGPGWPDRLGEALREWAQSATRVKVNALSLFSGAGGLDIGFHDAGFTVHTLVEIDERYVATLRANSSDEEGALGKARVECRDIREFSGDDLPRIDLILGGPPCQSFSAAGRRAHGVAALLDPRGVLFTEYVRLLERLQPAAFLFENVYGITGAQGGEPWLQIVSAFRDAGYQISHRILDAADFGVPQHRERLFIIGVQMGRPTFRFPRPTHGPDSRSSVAYFSAGEAISDLADDPVDGPTEVGGRYGELLPQIPPGLNYSFFTKKLGHPNPIFAWRSKFSDFLYKADPAMPVRTLKAHGGQYTGPFHWDNRPFSVAELKRLQTFPDSYKLVGNRQSVIQQIGNSVPPQLSRMLALAVLEDVFGISAPVPLPRLAPSERLSFRVLKRRRTAMYAQKAREVHVASESGEGPTRSVVRGRSYRAELTKGFDLVEDESGGLHVKESLRSSNWSIHVQRLTQCGGPPGFEITITPRQPMHWDLPVELIQLTSAETCPETFTGAWKALQSVLVRAQLKADLVQLNGYYQYAPTLRSSMKFSDPDLTVSGMWHVVESVVNGDGVGASLSAETLAFTWGIGSHQVHPMCEFLRSLGYEVRNNNTNPQIPEGHFLIPYVFPTLSGASVQLRKSLQ